MFCWAVKSGEYHRDFYILKLNVRLDITKSNFDRVRPTFGEWAAKVIATFREKSTLPCPSAKYGGSTQRDELQNV